MGLKQYNTLGLQGKHYGCEPTYMGLKHDNCPDGEIKLIQLRAYLYGVETEIDSAHFAPGE